MAIQSAGADLIGWNRGINTYSRFGEIRNQQNQSIETTIYYELIQRGLDHPAKLQKIINFVTDHKLTKGRNLLDSNRRLKTTSGRMRFQHLKKYLNMQTN